MSRKEFFPKGSMCSNCQHIGEDCSELCFESMPVLETIKNSQGEEYVFVKCVGFERAK